MTRPRVSICALTAVAVFLIGVLSVAAALQWIELGPLRREVQLLRKQMGHLRVENLDLPHAIMVDCNKPDCWKWRVYLPPLPTAQYVVNCSRGIYEPLTEENLDAALEQMRRSRRSQSISRTDPYTLEGELTIETTLTDREGYRYLDIRPLGGQVIGVPDHWREFEDKTKKLTGLSIGKQVVYARGEPMLLLCLQGQPRKVRFPFESENELRPMCDTVMLWVHSVD